MDILTAYKEEHGECPEWDDLEIGYWHRNKVYFTTGWKAALTWKEEQDVEIALQMIEEYFEYLDTLDYKNRTRANSAWKYNKTVWGLRDWLTQRAEQEELLEIEADVLYQQEGLTRGE